MNPEFDVVDRIMEFEAGRLNDDEVIALFQHLLDTGLAWRLQGAYGRMTQVLLLQGKLRYQA